MALSPTRHEYRLTLSHLDAAQHLEETVVLARHPSETAEHLVLRMLAWCLLRRDGLAFGAGLSDGDASDLCIEAAGGGYTLWVECGTAELEKLRRVASQNAGAEVEVVFAGPRRRNELLEQLAEHRKSHKGLDRVRLRTIEPSLVAALARHEERRQKWTVTIVEGHLYVEVDGEPLDGAVETTPLLG